jgi:hypothetical protein
VFTDDGDPAMQRHDSTTPLLRRAWHSTASLALAGALLAGCATPPPKAPPYAVAAGVPTAKLIMRAGVPTGDLYGVFVYDDTENCKGPRLAGAGGPSRNPPTVSLAAGTPATVEFLLLKANKESCALRWTFTPVAGKSYLINGIAYGAGCRASLVDASDPDAMKAPADLVRRNLAGQTCMNLSQARAAQSGSAVGGQDQGNAVLRPGANADDLKGLTGQ